MNSFFILGWMSEGWYWLIGIGGYFMYWRINYAINGGGGGLRQICEDYIADVKFAIPGGKRRRGEFIRKYIDELGPNTLGSMGGNSYEEIRTQDLYEEVGSKMLPGPLYFWGCVLFWLIWPISLPLLVIFLAVSWALHGIFVFFLGEKRVQDFYDRVFDFTETLLCTLLV